MGAPRDAASAAQSAREGAHARALGERALEAAAAVPFSWDPSTDDFECAGRLAVLLGRDAGERIALSDFLRQVQAQDRMAVERALRRAAEAGTRIECKLRLATRDGGVRPLRLAAGATREGACVRVSGWCAELADAEGADGPSPDAQDGSAGQGARADPSHEELLSMFSHELRSPLNAILGWNRILAVKRADDSEVSAIAARIERSARAQLAMLNDLVDLGRMRAGSLRLTLRPLRLARALGGVLDTARTNALAKGIELTTQLMAARAEVYGDAERLQQLTAHLLSNAIKFTDAAGRIALSLRAGIGHVDLAVTDSGRGIASERLARIFEGPRPAERGGGSGLGVGLSLVREIARLHGGTIEARSAGPGRGATLTLRLPLAQDRSAVDASAPTRRAMRLSGISILVVDDEADARAVVAESLRLEGARVHVADSAPAALAALAAPGARYDVIITDIGMPGEDGYSLLGKLRRLRGREGLPAIALTGYTTPADREAALAAGFDVHIGKPVDFEEFVPLVAGLAGRAAGSSARG